MTKRRHGSEARYYDDPAGVGRRLRLARERAGLSQVQLSFPGCSSPHISRIEAGTRTPSLQLMRELASRLGVSERYLAFGDEESEEADALLEAELALRMGDSDEAERLFRQELEADNARRRAAALAGLGQLAFGEGELHKAIELLEQAQALYGDEALRARSLIDTLGRAYAQTGELESAIALYERALAAADEREDVLDRVRYSVLLSYALSDAGQLKRAEELVGAALVHADELSDPQARIRLYWAQCRLHILAGRADVAERYGRRILDLLEASEDSALLAKAHSLVANIELDRERPEEALALLERARDLLGPSGSEFELATITLNEARAWAQLGEFERAADLAVAARGPLADRPEEAGHSYALLGNALAQAGDRARGIEILELACELLEQTPNRFLVEAYTSLAALLEQDGQAERALQLLKRAVAIRTEAPLAGRQEGERA